MAHDYEIIVMDFGLGRDEKVLTEHGLFGSSDQELLDARLDSLNAEADAAYREERSEQVRTHDWGSCPEHSYAYDDGGGCSCHRRLPIQSWASLRGIPYCYALPLSDEEALAWMEYGAKMASD